MAWDPNTEIDLAGYRVYYGTASRSYGPPIDVGNVTTCNIPGLTPGVTYYFAVSAYDTSQNESAYSNEVSGTVLVRQNNLADLTGELTSLVQTCRDTRRGAKCTISGKLTIQNIGILNAPSSFVRLYLSDDARYDEVSDTFLKQVRAGSIKAGKTWTITFRYSFPVGETVSGKYLISVIDVDNAVSEANESNNYAVSEQIPYLDTLVRSDDGDLPCEDLSHPFIFESNQNPVAIPTMTEGGMITLAILFGAGSLHHLRRRKLEI